MNEYIKLLPCVLEIEGLLRILETRNDSAVEKLLIEKIDILKNKVESLSKKELVDIDSSSGGNRSHGVSSTTEELFMEAIDETLPNINELDAEDKKQSVNIEIDKLEEIETNPLENQQIGESDEQKATQSVFLEEKENDGSASEESIAFGIPSNENHEVEAAVEHQAVSETPLNAYQPSQSINQKISQNVDQVRVEDIISQRELINFSKAFTINDRFRFTRELFGNDKSKFDEALNRLDQMDTLDEAYDYFLNELNWDADNECVSEFIALVASHFNALS